MNSSGDQIHRRSGSKENHALSFVDVPEPQLGSDFPPNPPISASPDSHSSKKKVWEGAYKKFLSRGKGKVSNDLDQDNSTTSKSSCGDTGKGFNTKKKSSSFSILPVPRRLISKSLPTTPQREKEIHSINDDDPAVPKPSLGQRVRSFGTGSHDKYDDNDKNLESTIRGGSYFKSVFSRRSTGGDKSSKNKGSYPDELDAPLRHGVEKTSASPEYGIGLVPETTDDIAMHTRIMPDNAERIISEDMNDTFGLNYLVESGSVTNLFGHNRGSSTHLSSGSYSAAEHELDGTDSITLPALLPPQNAVSLSIPRSRSNGIGLSLLSHQIQRTASNPQMYEKYQQNKSDDPTQPSSSPNTMISTLSDQSFTNSSSPSSLVHHHQMAVDPETKKMFTMYHNDARFNRDSTEPFLGNDVSSSERNYCHSTSATNAGLAAISRVSSVPYFTSTSMSYETLPLAPVYENGISVEQSMRLLKPLHGCEHWEPGRRYLIAAAALATCPLTVVDNLSGNTIYSAKEAAASPTAFGTVRLGEALITYIGQTRQLSAGKWSSCNLVLRQNYLLEYDVDAAEKSLPRGFAHLQLANAYASHDIANALELHFFASPCAQLDLRMLLIQLQNREDRDSWVFCLNRAARLQPRDLWEFDEDAEFGRGRYATVRPGRRKDKSYYSETEESGLEQEEKPQPRNRALKIIDKNEFWRRVIKGRERADTLVRELSVQSTLTAKCGHLPSILQLRGVFETSENLVLEMELLEGNDLFDYISRKGVMEESEACLVTGDILHSLEAMDRVGVAHRDIKPANLIMCKGEDDRIAVKVGDFGMSAFVGVDGLVRGRCGTPGYAAPEILNGSSGVGYGNQVDIFSAGVTLYVMLCGYEPFYGESEQDLIEANKSAIVEFPQRDWRDISSDARDLIRKMLKLDPAERITAKEGLEHPWMLQNGSEAAKKDTAADEFGDERLHLLLSRAPNADACEIS